MTDSDKIKLCKPEVKNEPVPKTAHEVSRVLKIETPQDSTIKSYALASIKEAGRGEYATIKAKCGPIAVTDPDRKVKDRKDNRFFISPMLRGPLAVEDEEARVINEKVKQIVDVVSEEAKKKGFSAGYEDGNKKGYDEAYQKFRQDGEDRLKKLELFLKECESAKAEIFRENERFLLELVFQIARMVALKEIAQDKDYITRLACELIEKVGVRENITVYIGRNDSESITKMNEGFIKNFGELKNLKIEVSDKIIDGGCRVETQWNAVDARIETQLKSIYENLLGEVKKEEPAPPLPAGNS